MVQDSLIWPNQLMNDTYLFRQGYFAYFRAGRCVVISFRGNYFAEFDAETAKPLRYFRYRDAFEFPAIVERHGRMVPNLSVTLRWRRP